jgi:outer membrane PBP1 activator LpoA protein
MILLWQVDTAIGVTLSDMDTAQLISEIDSEISRLQQARALLAGNHTVNRAKPHRSKRILSADARARIAAAQRKRWAKQKAEAKKSA